MNPEAVKKVKGSPYMRIHLLLYATALLLPNIASAQWRYVTSIVPPIPGHSSPEPIPVLGRTNDLMLGPNERATLIAFANEGRDLSGDAVLSFVKDGAVFPGEQQVSLVELEPGLNSNFEDVTLVGPATLRLSRPSGFVGSQGSSGALVTWHISTLQSNRFVTLFLSPSQTKETKGFSIATNQIARLVSFPRRAAQGGILEIDKDGSVLEIFPQLWFGFSLPTKAGAIMVAGPAKFTLKSSDQPEMGSFCTWEILPLSNDLGDTLTVTPGMGKVQINLEGSTDMMNWVVTTNGIYGSPFEERFFRIRVDRAL